MIGVEMVQKTIEKTIDLREKFLKWCRDTSIDAIQKIVEKNKQTPLKIMWLFCLLISICYCFFILTCSILEYLNYETTTYNGIYQESYAEFPAVVICRSGRELDDEDVRNIKLSCTFRKRPCDERDIEVVLTKQHGKCIGFNRDRDEVLISSKFGPSSGVTLDLFIGTENKTKPRELTLDLEPTNGLILFVANQTNFIKRENESNYELILTESGILLGPGTHANLAISRYYIIKQPYPYSNCVPTDLELVRNTSWVKSTIEQFRLYTQINCLDLCESNSTGKEICANECPMECERIWFRVASLSTANYPTKFYEKILLNHTILRKYTDDKDFVLRDSVTSVSVYYESDTYEEIRDIGKTDFSTLLANLGGQFGLFLGMSLLSFLELFELLIWTMLYCLQLLYFKLLQFFKKRSYDNGKKVQTTI